MMEFLGTLGVAIALFASTNIDDIFVLLSFFGDSNFRTRQIIIGQYLGIAALVLASILASLVSLVLEPAYVGLLGLLPIGIGIGKLLNLWRGEADGGADANRLKAGVGNGLVVAGVTIANGGDNIGIYTPVFATSTRSTLILLVSVFAVMVAIWLVFAHWLVNHPTIGAPIRRFGHWITPFVLIGIGFSVLHEANSISLIR